MRYKMFVPLIAIVVFVSCSNGESYNQNPDSGNMLQDTLPAKHNPPVAIPLDSMPADGTDVDSLNNKSH